MHTRDLYPELQLLHMALALTSVYGRQAVHLEAFDELLAVFKLLGFLLRDL